MVVSYAWVSLSRYKKSRVLLYNLLHVIKGGQQIKKKKIPWKNPPAVSYSWYLNVTLNNKMVCNAGQVVSSQMLCIPWILGAKLKTRMI